MSKNTIAIADIASMLAELGIGLAQHFDLDETEVMEYLDSVCKDKAGTNPQASKLLKEIQESTNIVTTDLIEEWFGPTKKGGLSIKDLRSKAKEYGLDIGSGAKKADIKEAFEGLIDEEDPEATEEMDNVDESETPTVTTDLIEEWFGPTKKGGLSIKDLRSKAKEYGLDIGSGAKKADIKEAFEGLINEKVEEVDDEDTEVDEPMTPTKEQIEKWCCQPSKGGVSINSLKHKAEELGINTDTLNKRSALKEVLLEAVEEPSPTIENKVKRNKEAKCWVVEGTQLVVQSQKNHTVVGYLTKAGERRDKLTKAMMTVAEERGLAVK